jgi:hypothetical protein
MKEIQPVSIWSNGTQQSANNISMYVINDNLIDSATFYYALMSVTTNVEGDTSSIQLAQGNLTMGGVDYINWGTAVDINADAFVWAATQLNLILV